MSENCVNTDCDRNALSIHTRKITDSCRDKDCIEDLRVWLTREGQSVLEKATTAKVRCADLITTTIEVEPVAFDRNHYCVDVTFYYRIIADAIVGCGRPVSLQGVAVFSKRAVLCGEDSKAHVFTSEQNGSTLLTDFGTNRPTAVVEVLDPMVLSSCVRDVCQCHCKDASVVQLPERVCRLFDEEFVMTGENRRLFVTLGQFSIVRLERDVQLVVPIVEYSTPTKECCDSPGCSEDPCEMFRRIPFPTGQFSPKNCDCNDTCDCG